MRSVFYVLIGVVFGFSGKAQESFYRDFDGVAQTESVNLEWVIQAGNSCFGTFIMRSLDGVDFDTVGIIAGLCGDDDEDIYYEFTDTAPVFNRINYYRLQFGNVTRSSVLPVEVIDLSRQLYQLVYDPGINQYTLYFSNPGRGVATLETYNYGGQRLTRESTQSDRFTGLRGDGLGFRVFVLWMEGKRVVSGHLP